MAYDKLHALGRKASPQAVPFRWQGQGGRGAQPQPEASGCHGNGWLGKAEGPQPGSRVRILVDLSLGRAVAPGFCDTLPPVQVEVTRPFRSPRAEEDSGSF